MEQSMQSKMYTCMEKIRYYYLHKWLMHANKKVDKRQTAMLAKWSKAGMCVRPVWDTKINGPKE